MYCEKIHRTSNNRPCTQIVIGRSTQAFTLIELLLGLAIFSIIALCVYSTFAGGIQLNLRSEQQNEIYREARWSQWLLVKDLENAVPYDFSMSYPDKFAFHGEKNEITLVLSAEDGLRVVRYYLMEPQRDEIHKVVVGETHAKNVAVVTERREALPEYYLMREEKPLIAYLRGASDANTEREIIGTHIKENGLRFSYGYSFLEQPEDYIWQNQWRYNKIPSHVRLEMDFLPAQPDQEAITLTRDIFIPHGTLERAG